MLLFLSMTTVWWRNPKLYINELIEQGQRRVIWDAPFLAKYGIEAAKFMRLHYGEGSLYEFMVVSRWGVGHYLSDNPEYPIGSYPYWDATMDPMSRLEALCAEPIGEDADFCNDPGVPEEFRPVLGQDHRIIITRTPDIKTMMGKQMLRVLAEIERDYENVSFHIHGTYAFAQHINLNFDAFDAEPRTDAAKKRMFIPTGGRFMVDEAHRHKNWISILGFKPSDLQEPRQRCMFNIRTIEWACQNAKKDRSVAILKTKNTPAPDIESSNDDFQPVVNNRPVMLSLKPRGGDRVDCDSCSLRVGCKFYREGSVCTLPGSEMSDLASMFHTTDSKSILEGLSRLTAMNAQRVEVAMDFERDFGIDPEVSKMVETTFKMGERLAKLYDPSLRASVNINKNLNQEIGAGNGAIQVTQLDPQDTARKAIEHYAALGFKQEEITQDMMRSFILQLSGITQQEIGAGTPVPVDAEVVE